MDFKKLIPDFNAVAKTDWAKPHIDTKDKNWLVVAGLVLLMVIFVFLPWQTLTELVSGKSQSESLLGITTWCGVLSFILALVAAYGVLYKQIQFTFCSSVLVAVLALIGWLTVFEMTKDGEVATSDQIKFFAELGAVKVSHIGAVLTLVAALATAAVSFLQIKKANE